MLKKLKELILICYVSKKIIYLFASKENFVVKSISKTKLYFEVSKTLYLKFKGVFFQKQNFKLNFKTIYIL